MRRIKRFRPAAAMVVAVVALLAGAPSSASAADCEQDLFDGAGFEWDFDSDGSIRDGLSDAYDGYGDLTVDTGGGEVTYSPSDPTACTLEDGDREVAYPAETGGFGGLEVSRKVYVPPSGLAFARTLDILSNPTGAAITATLRRRGNLGTDGDTEVVATSSGDTTITPADAWAVIDEDDFEDTKPTLLWDSDIPKADAADAHPSGPTSDSTPGPDGSDGEDDVEIVYENVTVPAGATVIYMHIDRQDNARRDGVDFAQANGGGPDEFYAGLSDTERSQLRNWPAIGDLDRDGVRNPQDNCPTRPNPGQENTDRDAQGDACDADDDNDGLSDAAEAEIGTNPTRADTDNDGVNDGTDRCPTRAGSDPQGCPAPGTVPVVTPGPPVVTPGPPVVTTVPAADRERPRVTIRGVPWRRCVSRAFTARIRIADQSSLERVDVFLDGKRLRRTMRTRVSVLINVPRLRRSGTQRLSVVAVDQAGNVERKVVVFVHCPRGRQRR